MTNQTVLTQLLGDPPRDPAERHDEPSGFLDCRGEWQDLDEGEDRDAAP